VQNSLKPAAHVAYTQHSGYATPRNPGDPTGSPNRTSCRYRFSLPPLRCPGHCLPVYLHAQEEDQPLHRARRPKTRHQGHWREHWPVGSWLRRNHI